jgi:hypothetical protein
VDKSATRRSADQGAGSRSRAGVLALVELGPAPLEALPDGVFDVAKVAVGWPWPCRSSTTARALVGDARPNPHHHPTAWVRREGVRPLGRGFGGRRRHELVQEVRARLAAGHGYRPQGWP